MRTKLITAALLVAAALPTLHCQRSASAQPGGPTPPPNEVWVTSKQIREAGIATADVALHPVGNVLATTGRIAFSDSRVAHVFSPVTGRVTRLAAALGDSVGRGAPLAVIESPDLGTAVSDLEKADADLVAAQRELERQKELYDAHAAAQRDFEAAESAFRKARAEKARAAQKSSLLASGRSGGGEGGYILRAPIAGDVVARTATLGMEVQGQYSGGAAAELFTVGALDPVWVLADVFEVDLPRVKIGAPAAVSVVAYPDRLFRGRVDWISGAFDPATRTVKVRCIIDNGDRLLRPEMYATVALTTGARPSLAVPRTAVVRAGEQTIAFVDKGASPDGGERYERRIVAVDDAEGGDYLPVLRGLAPGERVVSSGAVLLSGIER
jgi:cobalt-zinc-cadmium efflux system membrane fusion protein